MAYIHLNIKTSLPLCMASQQKQEIADAVKQQKKETLEDKLPQPKISVYVATSSGYAYPSRYGK